MLPPHSLPLATLVRTLRSARTVNHRSDHERVIAAGTSLPRTASRCCAAAASATFHDHSHDHNHNHGNNEEDSFGDLDNLTLPPDTMLEVVVELVSVEESSFTTAEHWQLSPADRLARALLLRRTAAAAIAAGDATSALRDYAAASDCAVSVSTQLVTDRVNVLYVKRNSNLADLVSDLRSGVIVVDSTKTPDNNAVTNGVADSSEVDDTVVATVSASGISQLDIDLRANAALCLLRLGRLEACIAMCSMVLRDCPTHAKILLRRARARRLLGSELDAALDDCIAVGNAARKLIAAGEVDERELTRLRGEVADAEREAAALRPLVEREARAEQIRCAKMLSGV